MARQCHFCGKSARVGNNVSHANNRTKRRFLPNLQPVKISQKGRTMRVLSCTRCIRTGSFLTV